MTHLAFIAWSASGPICYPDASISPADVSPGSEVTASSMKRPLWGRIETTWCAIHTSTGNCLYVICSPSLLGYEPTRHFCQGGSRQPAETPGPGQALAGGQPFTPCPSGNGKPIEDYCQVDLRPCPARATIQVPSGYRASTEGTGPGEEVPGQPLLPAPRGACSDWFFSA